MYLEHNSDETEWMQTQQLRINVLSDTILVNKADQHIPQLHQGIRLGTILQWISVEIKEDSKNAATVKKLILLRHVLYQVTDGNQVSFLKYPI